MKSFDLVIIGGGVAGLVAASGASQLGARVALVDKASLGGDCLNYGCVPTKRLVHSAKVAFTVKHASDSGVEAAPYTVDFPKVMELMRAVQRAIGEHDDPERFRKMGVEVIFGSGAFTDPSTFEVNGEKIRGRRFIIATGTRPANPPIKGMMEVGPLTNETVLELKSLPASIFILGAGPIGIEYAQIFARLGSRVTLVKKYDRILPKEDAELAGELEKVLETEGVAIIRAVIKELKRLDAKENGQAGVELTADFGNTEKTFRAEAVMAAIGRRPNVEDLGLEVAGVEYDARKGIRVDGTLRTSNKRIYACGDVTGSYPFTHVAEYHAGIALGNALFPVFKRKADYRVVPWATFTDPELAHVGLTEAEAAARYGEKNLRVYQHSFSENDRAVMEGEAAGRIKLVCDRRGALLGAHILGPRAGELIHEYVLAMRLKAPVSKISGTIHVYPTLSQAAKRAADQYYKEKLFTGWFPKIAKWLIKRGR